MIPGSKHHPACVVQVCVTSGESFLREYYIYLGWIYILFCTDLKKAECPSWCGSNQ